MRGRLEAIVPDRLLSMGSIWAHRGQLSHRFGCGNNIEMLVDTRNCLAHGLCSARADPRSRAEPHVVCRTAAGKQAIKMSEFESVAHALHLALTRFT